MSAPSSARPPRPSVVSGGLWTLLNRVLPQAQLLVLSIIVARYLGPTDMGRQSYIAFASIALVQVATAGMPMALSRFIGELLGARRGGEAMSLYQFTRRVERVAAALGAALAGDRRAARRRPARGLGAGRPERGAGRAAGRADEPARGRAALARELGPGPGDRRRHRAADDLRARAGRRHHRALRRSRPRRSSSTCSGAPRSRAGWWSSCREPEPVPPRAAAALSAPSPGSTSILVIIQFVVWRRSELFVLQHYSTDAQIAFYSIAFAAISGLSKLPGDPSRR